MPQKRTVFAAFFWVTIMTLAELKQKALSLPQEPGVYIMQDKTGRVIYVGKAKKLKNRVSQYFRDSASHSGKTRRMVSQVDHFDTIVAGTEFEALVLECSLIKQHMPRYNILLKDDKGYPYIRLDRKKPYPRLELVGKLAEDGAEYFGPYGGRFVTQRVMDTIRLTLGLPSCGKDLSRDRGKSRPCLNYHMGNCAGWCREEKTPEQYDACVEQAVRLLRGKYAEVSRRIRADMDRAAEELRFEEAAVLRDRLKAIEVLREKQSVTAGSRAHADAIGYYANGCKACFAVLHFLDGKLVDKEYQILRGEEEDREEAVSALVKQYYTARGAAPGEILLPVPMEDGDLFAELLRRNYGKKVYIHVPERGEGVRLTALAESNAREEAERITSAEEKRRGVLMRLKKLLELQELPERIEAFDISNTAGKDIVAGMVVYTDGKPCKSGYRRFRIDGMENQDDYGSLRQAVSRRFTRFLAGDGGFSEKPELLLIDGGEKQAACVEEVLTSLALEIPVFGMVKDDRHRTRALVDALGREYGISGDPGLFSFLGGLQEEVHRFAITYHKKLRSGHLRGSELEKIAGIGEKRRSALLKHFKSVKAVSEADRHSLEAVLPESAAEAVWNYFHGGEGSA